MWGIGIIILYMSTMSMLIGVHGSPCKSYLTAKRPCTNHQKPVQAVTEPYILYDLKKFDFEHFLVYLKEMEILAPKILHIFDSNISKINEKSPTVVSELDEAVLSSVKLLESDGKTILSHLANTTTQTKALRTIYYLIITAICQIIESERASIKIQSLKLASLMIKLVVEKILMASITNIFERQTGLLLFFPDHWRLCCVVSYLLDQNFSLFKLPRRQFESEDMSEIFGPIWNVYLTKLVLKINAVISAPNCALNAINTKEDDPKSSNKCCLCRFCNHDISLSNPSSSSSGGIDSETFNSMPINKTPNKGQNVNKDENHFMERLANDQVNYYLTTETPPQRSGLIHDSSLNHETDISDEANELEKNTHFGVINHMESLQISSSAEKSGIMTSKSTAGVVNGAQSLSINEDGIPSETKIDDVEIGLSDQFESDESIKRVLDAALSHENDKNSIFDQNSITSTKKSSNGRINDFKRSAEDDPQDKVENDVCENLQNIFGLKSEQKAVSDHLNQESQKVYPNPNVDSVIPLNISEEDVCWSALRQELALNDWDDFETNLSEKFELNQIEETLNTQSITLSKIIDPELTIGNATDEINHIVLDSVVEDAFPENLPPFGSNIFDEKNQLKTPSEIKDLTCSPSQKSINELSNLYDGKIETENPDEEREEKQEFTKKLNDVQIKPRYPSDSCEKVQKTIESREKINIQPGSTNHEGLIVLNLSLNQNSKKKLAEFDALTSEKSSSAVLPQSSSSPVISKNSEKVKKPNWVKFRKTKRSSDTGSKEEFLKGKPFDKDRLVHGDSNQKKSLNGNKVSVSTEEFSSPIIPQESKRPKCTRTKLPFKMKNKKCPEVNKKRIKTVLKPNSDNRDGESNKKTNLIKRTLVIGLASALSLTVSFLLIINISDLKI